MQPWELEVFPPQLLELLAQLPLVWAEDSNLGGKGISHNGGSSAVLITSTDLPATVGGSNFRGHSGALISANLPPLLY